ncbi:MAG TPA: cellulase family glycosylhydrolase [Mycobacteriales bacterium]|nr:cellulase family glycosylhydrolase [Mycobacteriales bacterium]
MIARARRALGVLTAIITTGTMLATALPAASAPTRSPASATGPGLGRPATAEPQLRHRGPFLVDGTGRVVIIHGINAVYKRPPYVAPATRRGFTARDARFLAANGINGVRLGVLFAGVMPKRGVIDHRYLDRVDRIVKLLAAHHIWVLLDFHQDAFNERFDGEGFPAWAVHDDGLPFANLGSFFVNDQQPAVEDTYSHLWNDDYDLWRYYTQAWVAVAKKWRNQPYLMGYDLFNEPNGGLQMLTCANPLGCPIFDATLERFYNHIRVAIRKVDAHNLVWFEPQFLFNAISASSFTRVDDPEVGLSWHDYACTTAFVEGGVVPGGLDCKVNEPRVMDNAADQIRRLGSGGLMSEFGAGDDLGDLADMTRYADEHLTGWMYWAYKLWNDPTGSAQEGLYADDARPSTVKTAKLVVLSHPYPQEIAGTPTAMSWNPDTKTLTFSYRPRRGIGPTVVFVPARMHPRRFVVSVAGGSVTSGRGTSFLKVAAKPRARTVSVTVKPRPHRTK